MIKRLVASMSLTIVLVFGLLFALLAGLSFYFNLGIFVTVGLAVGLGFFQWSIGPSIVRWSTKMIPLNKKEFPWIEETIHEICIKNKVKIPKITIANTSMPNAFVFGRTSKSATLTLTRGLLNTLTKDEVRGVIAHEIGHIKHNDMVVMTVISVIPTIAYFIALSTMFGGRTRNQGGTAMLIGIGAFVVYFITNLLILYFSRLREFYADDFAGRQVKPTILANALAKITYGLSLQKQQAKNSTLRSFYAVDPISASYEVTKFSSHYEDQNISEDEVKKAMDWERSSFSKFGEIFRTHPLTYKRIDKLYQLERGF